VRRRHSGLGPAVRRGARSSSPDPGRLGLGGAPGLSAAPCCAAPILCKPLIHKYFTTNMLHRSTLGVASAAVANGHLANARSKSWNEAGSKRFSRSAWMSNWQSSCCCSRSMGWGRWSGVSPDGAQGGSTGPGAAGFWADRPRMPRPGRRSPGARAVDQRADPPVAVRGRSAT
jgi:hypothetical protein